MCALKKDKLRFSLIFYWKNILKILKYLFRKTTLLLGILILFLIVFSFTSGPFWIYHYLGTHGCILKGQPQGIILLGGGGMPSESGLIRCYHTAVLANGYPDSKIIIALPADSLTSESSIMKMRQELILRGVDSNRIYLEFRGKNTRGQALNCIEMNVFDRGDTTYIVTSPEHMLRSIKTFKKAGYNNITGYPAFEYAIESDLKFEDEKLGGRKGVTPDIGGNINIRYRFWTHLKYEILIVRECSAFIYYKLRGWV